MQRNSWSLVLFFCLAAFAQPRLHAEVISVCREGCDYTSINDAISVATDGDVIKLSSEVYTEGSTIDLQGKSLSIEGELGSDGVPSTILDGENSYQVVRMVGSQSVVLKNLWLTRGSASSGGGLYASLSGVVLQGIHVSECQSEGSGGGVFTHRSVVEVLDCVFTGNSSGSHGGGFYGGLNSNSNLVLRFRFERCSFVSNTAAAQGGGVRLYRGLSSGELSNSILELAFCTFEGNTADLGGGACLFSYNGPAGESAMVRGCEFVGNSARRGGGIYASRVITSSWLEYLSAIEDCSFRENVAGEAGGGLEIKWSGARVGRCVFANNDAPVGSGISLDSAEFGPPPYDRRPLQISQSVFCGGGVPAISGYWENPGDNVFAVSCEDNNADGIPDEWEGADLDQDGELEVPAEFGSPLAAVAAAGPDDVVTVGPGTFLLLAPIDIVDRDVSIRGTVDATGEPVTVFDAQNAFRVMRIAGESARCTAENLVLQRGLVGSIPFSDSPRFARYGGGILLNRGELNAANCDLTLCGNAAVYSEGGNVHMSGCDFSLNTGDWRSQCLLEGSAVSFVGCSFLDGGASYAAIGLWPIDGLPGSAAFDYCSIIDNGGDGIVALFPAVIRQSTVTGNSGRGIYVSSLVELANARVCGNGGEEVSGDFVDLGGNLIAEECESDCNFNGIVDTVDIVNGTSTDCDADGQPDECQFVSTRSLSVPRLPTSLADAVEFDVSELGEAYDDVVLEIAASGDLGSASEFLIAYLDDTQLGLVFLTDGLACSPLSDFLSIPAAAWNEAGADGHRLIRIAGVNVQAGACPDEYLALQVTVPVLYTDCDGNGVWDICDINEGGAPDQDGNGLPDTCDADCDGDGEPNAYEISSGQSEDCNSTGIPDECEIADGASADVDGDGVPDECQEDCDGDGLPDAWEIQTGTAMDCNRNLLPDDCDITSGVSSDVDANGIPDECKEDCNGNGVPDYWEILKGQVPDCNGNGVPDSCDIAGGAVPDCDLDGIPDGCAVDGGTVPDCNDNGIPDSCDIDGPSDEDDNGNGIPDACELVEGDLNLDGCIDAADMGLLFVVWGLPNPPFGDLDGDGVAAAGDLGVLLTAWNPCP